MPKNTPTANASRQRRYQFAAWRQDKARLDPPTLPVSVTMAAAYTVYMHSLSGPTVMYPCHDVHDDITYWWLWINHGTHRSQICCPPPWGELAKDIPPGSVIWVEGRWQARTRKMREEDLPYFLVARHLAVLSRRDTDHKRWAGLFKNNSNR